MQNYEHLTDDLIMMMGTTPKERYETVLALHSELGKRKGTIDYLLSNIKAIAESEGIDETFKNLLMTVHEIGSKP